MPDEIIIYTKPGCPYCAAVKEDFKEKGIEYTEYDVKSDPAIREKAIALAGLAAVPVIVRNGKVTVGFGGS